jgi:hypothetical protein
MYDRFDEFSFKEVEQLKKRIEAFDRIKKERRKSCRSKLDQYSFNLMCCDADLDTYMNTLADQPELLDCLEVSAALDAVQDLSSRLEDAISGLDMAIDNAKEDI